MSATLTLLSAAEAQRLTQRIKITASSVRDGLFKLRNLVEEARRSNVWQVLGYPSWTAYLADTLADEPMRLGRDERQELVSYLSGEGLSVRAIAPIVGVSKSQVATDIEVSSSGHLNDPTVEDRHAVETAPPVDGAARVEAVPEPPRAVTGLDGKTYKRPEPRPTPAVPSGDAAALLNAETESKAVGRALMTLSHMQTDSHRDRLITEWWPLGNEAVPPDSRALFEPRAIRDIATWLMRLADDLEGES